MANIFMMNISIVSYFILDAHKYSFLLALQKKTSLIEDRKFLDLKILDIFFYDESLHLKIIS